MKSLQFLLPIYLNNYIAVQLCAIVATFIYFSVTLQPLHSSYCPSLLPLSISLSPSLSSPSLPPLLTSMYVQSSVQWERNGDTLVIYQNLTCRSRSQVVSACCVTLSVWSLSLFHHCSPFIFLSSSCTLLSFISASFHTLISPHPLSPIISSLPSSLPFSVVSFSLLPSLLAVSLTHMSKSLPFILLSPPFSLSTYPLLTFSSIFSQHLPSFNFLLHSLLTLTFF